MRIGDKVRKMVKKWLDIQPAGDRHIVIKEPMSFETNVLKNLLWYRGEAEELEQFFMAAATTTVAQQRFWAASYAAERIRKIHSGLPAMIADVLSQSVSADVQNITIEEEEANRRWKEIANLNKFSEMLAKTVTDMLITGDGAFKINIDSEISKRPIIEFRDASKVEYKYKSGHIVEIVFSSVYNHKDNEYILKEHYGKGKVEYKLYCEDNEVALETVPELAELKAVSFEGDFIMAVPFMVWPSKKFAGRGKSIFDNKTDAFDAFDEIISQWLDAVRAGRVKHYIPEDLIPRGSKGELLNFDSFGHTFVQTATVNTEGAKKEIHTVQPDIKYDAFLTSYTTTLDLCLQGIISPATLGINIGKMSSGEAQREKKDITGVTRNAITAVLEKVVPQLIDTCLKVDDVNCGRPVGEYVATITFGEYGAPDFDSRVATISAATTSGIMSTKAAVEELWGTSKTEDWKKDEVKRINLEKGIEEMDEPSVGADII